MVPRTVLRASSLRAMPAVFVAVTRERWPRAHVRFALLGLGTWYLTYVAFRNLKSFVPFVNDRLWDGEPAGVLHDLLGTGWAAHAMSWIYLGWIVFVPFSRVVALVWSRNVAAGAWYVTAVAVDRVLGVATYYLLPSVGPIYARPAQFDDLAHTHVTDLQGIMTGDRQEVLADPAATDAVQTIAAFASLMWVSAIVTGNHVRGRPVYLPQHAHERTRV